MAGQESLRKEIDELIKKGSFLQAIDIAQKEISHSNDIQLKQAYALALSRMGHTDQAMEILQPLLKDEVNNSDVRALVGGVLKRHWIATGDAAYLGEAYKHYLHSFRTGKTYWAGINAATLAISC